MRRVALSFVVMALLVAAALADVRVQMHLRRRVSEEAIEQEFVKRSTPGSALYQQHLSHEELVKLVGATPEALATAERFLAGEAGVSERRVFSTQDVLTAVVERTSPVAAKLGLTAAMFERSAVRHTVAVPAALAGAVDRIVVVPRAPKRATKPRVAMGGAGGFPGMQQTPATISQRYKVPTTPLSGSVVQGVGEFQQSYFNPAWINNFTTKYALPKADIRINGPNTPSPDDVEGTLDLEYIVGLAPDATTWWISYNGTGPDPFGIDFAWWAENAAALRPMPTVVSLSWGIGENNYAGKAGVLDADNDAFRKLGLLGVSVFAASGDTGPGSRGYTSCSRFDPGWPATSPYVTSVGATYALSETASESAVSFSGGGFSDYFGTPEWQREAAAAYLANASGLPKPSFYNASGRGFPDVAALGTNFMVYGQNQFGEAEWMPVSGTSCASPTFAALITRVNAARVKAGKGTLGFLNPTLYKLGRVGQDVTTGSSQDPDCFGFPIPGFPTAAGWDPVSGLGTPDYSYLVQQLA